jgi:hypothetical protein
MSDVDLDLLASRFRQFAELECRGSSQLYESLATAIARDRDLLKLASRAPSRQPVPNLLFAAVHYLLLSGKDHELQGFYPNIVAEPKDHKMAFPSFKDFCASHHDEIVQLLQTRRVQTNAVRRCAYLYPAFCRIYQRLAKPLALMEIGTAAGLNLIWDEYSYSYGDGEVVGAEGSSVQITSTINGPNKPSLEDRPPPVIYRVGVDIRIVDLTDDDHLLWLRALIWPEHKERVELMTRAAEVLRADPPRLVQGDAIEMLQGFSREAPMEAVLCIYHTHVANQFSREKKETLFRIVDSIADRRAVCHIYNNMQDGFLHLDILGVNSPSKETIAKTDGHARWFEWMPGR